MTATVQIFFDIGFSYKNDNAVEILKGFLTFNEKRREIWQKITVDNYWFCYFHDFKIRATSNLKLKGNLHKLKIEFCDLFETW